MTTTTTKINLLGSSQTDLEKFLVARSEKPFRARQIMQWIYQRDIDDFDEMTDLSKSLRTQRRRRLLHQRYRLNISPRMVVSSGCSRAALDRRSKLCLFQSLIEERCVFHRR
jgi:adenine C2-methylase RlmN of 23S rRNA A2503 and tRNA A37